MERMDVAKDLAVKMEGEDLAHAYDAVRVANKSVITHSFIPFSETCFPFNLMLRLRFGGRTPWSCFISPLVCVRFLESQLRGQRGQWEEELEALRCQLSQAISGCSSASQQQVLTCHLWCIKESESVYTLKKMARKVLMVFVSTF